MSDLGDWATLQAPIVEILWTVRAKPVEKLRAKFFQPSDLPKEPR